MYIRRVKQGQALSQVSNPSSFQTPDFAYLKRSSGTNVKKHEQLTRSLRKMERTLDTVLRSIGNPGLSSVASGMVSRSPSPSINPGMDNGFSGSPSSSSRSVAASHRQPGSPRLHSLPDNDLNPLGLLAEASLANRRAQTQSNFKADDSSLARGNNVGVANDVYFKPGAFKSSHIGLLLNFV